VRVWRWARGVPGARERMRWCWICIGVASRRHCRARAGAANLTVVSAGGAAGFVGESNASQTADTARKTPFRTLDPPRKPRLSLLTGSEDLWDSLRAFCWCGAGLVYRASTTQPHVTTKACCSRERQMAVGRGEIGTEMGLYLVLSPRPCATRRAW
jgi:hypothetical protein